MKVDACGPHPLVRYLRNPACGVELSTNDWEKLLRAARHAQLASRVAWLARSAGFLEQLPQKIQLHLRSAMLIADGQSVSVKWEVRQIQAALSHAAIAFVLLKGAAYIIGNLDSAHGRLMSDIDIMVPKARLSEAEAALYANGWFPMKIDAYDQRYYREWMHELPPMQHLGRGTSLDVHHTILPPTALLKPDVEKLWMSAIAVDSGAQIFVLSPVDMVLHSATHLFHDGELSHGLRDLVDIDALIRQFSSEPGFFQTLAHRATELELGRPLHYALRNCRRFLHTAIPDDVLDLVARHESQSKAIRTIMDVVVPASIGAILQDRPDFKSSASGFAMYVRSHYLRMPMHQLIPHLVRKHFTKET